MGKRAVIILLSLIVIGGGLLRLYHVRQLGTFLADQAVELEGARQIAQGKLTLIGIKTSNSEMRNGAVMYYILAPFLTLLQNDPIAGSILQSFLSLLAVCVTFVLGNKLKNNYTGLLAAFFIAASALIIRYSRQTLLAQYPLFFCSLAFLLLYYIHQRATRLRSFLVGVLLGFMLQIHYATLSVVLASVVFPFFFLKHNKKTFFLFLMGGLAIGFAPMIVFELRHEFFNTHMFLKLLVERKSVNYPSFFEYVSYFNSVISNLFLPQLRQSGYIIIALLFIYVIKFRRLLHVIEKIALLLICTSVVFVIGIGKDLIPHYAIAAFVPLSVLTTSFLYRISKIVSFPYKIVFGVTALLFLLVNFPSYGFWDSHGWMMSEGWNLVGTRKAADMIQDDMASFSGKQYNVTMLVDAQTQAIPLRYFLNQKRPPLAVEHYDIPDYLYVVAPEDINLKNSTLWEITSFGAFEIEKRWNIQNIYFLYRLGKKMV